MTARGAVICRPLSFAGGCLPGRGTARRAASAESSSSQQFKTMCASRPWPFITNCQQFLSPQTSSTSSADLSGLRARATASHRSLYFENAYGTRRFVCRRPRYVGAEDIGSWQKVLETLG